MGRMLRALIVVLLWCPVIAHAFFNFDLTEANKSLQSVNDYLKQPNIATFNLEEYQKQIENLQGQALVCIDAENAQLAEINQLEQEINAIGFNLPTYEQDLKYIQDRKQAVSLKLFGCRLFELQSQETKTQIFEALKIQNKISSTVADRTAWEAAEGALLTFGAILIFISIVYLGNIIFDHSKLYQLSVIRRQRYAEFMIFKFSLYAALACWAILMLLEWWGVPINLLEQVKQVLLEGGTVYGVHIIPMRLLLGLMVFALIQMVWKYGLLYISKRQQFDPEADSQVVLTSILSYMVFTIAVLVGLAISGVNFTGIAIVAGALSVGIGFGLQNIVNNFVSGIILLLEKTVKPGDRVSIKGHEGFVRKINLRYTRISTPNKDDVLIPNSDLISTPIINFEFEDKLCNIKCHVGVSYKSDLELVKQTLLNVATKHPEVLHDPMNKANVYIIEYDDHNIIFELQCIITDVNKKSAIISDLYTLIVAAFKSNNIVMSYPQLDVHITRQE